ncbi:hypothetical protein ACVINW_007585 [Bradyrhizobium sp. USDA 4461]
MSTIIKEMIASLAARHKADEELDRPEPQRLLSDAALEKWSVQSELPRDDLYDALALELASEFNKKTLDFDFCDRVVNELLGHYGRASRFAPFVLGCLLSLRCG